MCSKLRHPNILQFLGASVNGPHVALITEYMNGGSLYAHLHPSTGCRPLPLPELLRLALGIARGMNYLHLHRPPIIHRDLKSLNILLTSDSVKVADFGLSRVRASTHLMSKVCGLASRLCLSLFSLLLSNFLSLSLSSFVSVVVMKV